jgi:Mrp family chromosome partitioning ATPase
MGVGDTLAFARSADCALLVVRAEQSLLDDANEAARRLERAGIRLEGVIFNGVRPARHGGLAQV